MLEAAMNWAKDLENSYRLQEESQAIEDDLHNLLSDIQEILRTPGIKPNSTCPKCKAGIMKLMTDMIPRKPLIMKSLRARCNKCSYEGRVSAWLNKVVNGPTQQDH
jgi:hypothetical protein